MAASKFEDKLDSSSYCDIQSYFSGKSSSTKEVSNKESLPTRASTTIENTTTPKKTTVIDSKSDLMCIKDPDHAKKSITSYFTSKNCSNQDLLDDESESAKSMELTIAEDKAKKSENAVESKVSIVNFFRRKQLNEPDMLNNLELASTKSDKNEDFHSLTFQSNSCVSSIVNDKEFTDTTNEGTSCAYEKFDATSEKSKRMGFFAKKLKERCESNLSNETTKSPNINSEPSKVSETGVHISDPSTSTSEINFYHSASENENENSNLDPELTNLCEKCNKRIPVWEETEHLDYHLALDLSKEFSNKPNSSNAFVSKSSIMGRNISKPKRGKKRGSATKTSTQAKKPLVQAKTLDAFFK